MRGHSVSVELYGRPQQLGMSCGYRKSDRHFLHDAQTFASLLKSARPVLWTVTYRGHEVGGSADVRSDHHKGDGEADPIL